MLIDKLNECIIDMKTVHEMETVSADTKKQAIADYNFKQLILSLKQMVDEVNLAVENSEFRPSANVISALKSFLSSCDKIVQAGAANSTTTSYISAESKKLYSDIGQEWSLFYTEYTKNMVGLLNTIKGILEDEKRAVYALNKIKKAAVWNTDIENYDYLKQGMNEAEEVFDELGLDENSPKLEFLKILSAGNATIENLTEEIWKWIIEEGLAGKIKLYL